jgi:hypothetical protein
MATGLEPDDPTFVQNWSAFLKEVGERVARDHQ